jgi:hypothetical protein
MKFKPPVGGVNKGNKASSKENPKATKSNIQIAPEFEGRKLFDIWSVLFGASNYISAGTNC